MSEDLTPDDVRQLKIAMRGLALLGLVAMIIAIAGPKYSWASDAGRFCVSGVGVERS